MAGGPKRDEFHIPKAEEDDGVELSLGLSVGGSSQKPEGATESPKGFNAGMIAERSGVLPLFPTDDPDLLDPEQKREYHALRRKEARRKQDEKLQRRGILRGRSRVIQAYPPRPARASSSEDRAALKAPDQQARALDRQARENEPSGGGGPERLSSGQKGRQYSERNTNPASLVPNPSPICGTNPSPVFKHSPNPVLNPTPISIANPSPIPDHTPPPISFGVPPVPVPVPLMPMQIPYQPLPFVPYGNGYAITCMVPCWAPAIPTIQPLSPTPAAANGLDQMERSAFHPVPQRAVRPLVPPAHPGGNSGGPGYDQEMNAGKVVLVTRIPSWSDSLHGSEHRSNSIHGGGSSSSSDARTNSSSTVSEKRRLCIAPLGIPRGRHSDHSISPHHASSSSTTNKVVHRAGQPSPMSKPNVAMPYRVKLEGAASVYLNPEDPSDESEMPFVATTGDGPDGKTITGFLYSYSKGEVSIMCVCHGSTFTPAEFVRHAGGTDMEHPLKHIVIVPSA